jgi:Raf kinase inhibitor-like YbhB/YbcL family protein
MKLTSPAFAENGAIPPTHTCDGSNQSPPLIFTGIPPEAKSLVLIMDDSDVPKDLLPSGVFDHWIVFNIPPDTAGVGANETLRGIHGANSAGQAKYTGPCPPDREHRYFFRLYALDAELELPKGASKAEVLKAMVGHILTNAQLMGRYNRPANIKD